MTTTNMLAAIDWGTQIMVGADRAITFSFASSGTAMQGATTVPFTALEKDAARTALEFFQNALNVTFQEVASGGTLRFGMVDFPPHLYGQASPPGEADAGSIALDIDYRTNQPDHPGGYTGPGGAYFVTLMHEIGHALGLAHPHDDGGTSDIYSGVTAAGMTGDFQQNQQIFTVMSYVNSWNLVPGTDVTSSRGHPYGPMAYDIAMLQAKYGARGDFNNGNTVYTIFDGDLDGHGFQSIWDTGGIDTIAYNGTKSVNIDLRAATLGYEAAGGGFVSATGTIDITAGNPSSLSVGGASGFTIANGVTIENAIGSSDWDLLIGNDSPNDLRGLAGVDSLYGNAGFDTLIGGAGRDLLDGGSEIDTASYETSASAVNVDLSQGKALNGDAQGDTLVNIESLTGSAFNDQLGGDGGFNLLRGGDGDDRLDGRGSDVGGDLVFGEGGDDYVIARAGGQNSGGVGGFDTIEFAATSDTFVELDRLNGVRLGAAAGVVFTGFEQFIGREGNDILLGNDESETFAGITGDDTIRGRGGSDTLIGGSGADILDGGDGFDKIDYSLSTGGVGVDLQRADGKVAGGDGAGDTLVSIENVTGSGLADTLLGNGVTNVLRGGAGNDVIDGGGAIDFIYGDGGDDEITAGVGADLEFVDGGAGFDTVVLSGNGILLDLPTMNNPNVFNGGFRDVERFVGTAGADIMNGDGAANSFVGGLGSDVLSGGGGNDMLEGGLGDDALNGDGGEDTAVWTGATGDIVFALDGDGSGGIVADVAGIGLDFLFGIENIQAGGGNDTITGNAFDNKLWGNAGGDTLAGGGGNDTLDGGAGTDAMAGGIGNDVYFVDNAGDTAVELAGAGGGVDQVKTALASYTLDANVEKLAFTDTGAHTGKGNALNNTLNGNAGDDKFLADSAGNDVFSGGAGSDSMDFRAGAAGATINLATGVHGGAALGDIFASMEKFFGSNTAADTMTAGAGRANFSGFGGNDRLAGGTNIDVLSGGAGSDTLNGGAGVDTLQGGKDADTMTGGAGGDYFLYIETAASGGWGADTVTDFADGLDRIKIDAPGVASSIADFTIAGNGTSSVLLTLNALPSSTIALNGAGPITITAADFLFY